MPRLARLRASAPAITPAVVAATRNLLTPTIFTSASDWGPNGAFGGHGHSYSRFFPVYQLYDEPTKTAKAHVVCISRSTQAFYNARFAGESAAHPSVPCAFQNRASQRFSRISYVHPGAVHEPRYLLGMRPRYYGSTLYPDTNQGYVNLWNAVRASAVQPTGATALPAADGSDIVRVALFFISDGVEQDMASAYRDWNAALSTIYSPAFFLPALAVEYLILIVWDSPSPEYGHLSDFNFVSGASVQLASGLAHYALGGDGAYRVGAQLTAQQQVRYTMLYLDRGNAPSPTPTAIRYTETS